MVRLKALARAYDQLRTCEIHMSDYRESTARDAVFSLTTIDTFLAGIADTLLAGRAVPFEHRTFIRDGRLIADRRWVMDSGELFDLTAFPELLAWAKIIEAVRKECVASLGG